MQQRQRDPQHGERKQPDQAAKRVCEDHALVGRGTLGRAREPLVQHLVQPVQHAADTDDQVPECAVLGLVRRGGFVAAGTASRLRAVLRRRGVTIGYHEDAGHGNSDGDDLAGAHLLVQDGDAEGVGEEGGAVVDGGQVGGGGLVDGDVPGAAGEGEGACDEDGHLDHVAHGADQRLARGGVQRLVLHHEGRLAQQLRVAPPEGRPRLVAVLQA